MEIDLQVLIAPHAHGLTENAISFETGLTRKQAADPTLYAYEHHGPEFTTADPGALWAFYEDVAMGRPMPTKFVTCHLAGIDTLFALALFLHRDLATHPAVPALFSCVDFIHRRGVPAFAHVEQDLARFLRLLAAMTPPTLTKQVEAERIRTCVDWIYDYATQGQLPPLGPYLPVPKVLDAGTNGFVLAELKGDLLAGWVELYRLGYLRGVLLGAETEGVRSVVASRKSVYVRFNLSHAAELLNELEGASGRSPGWKADELWLFSPELGTGLTPQQMMEVFLRV